MSSNKKLMMPRKLTKPIISVNVVMITPPAIAGSQPNLLRKIGKRKPNIAAASRLKIIANDIANDR